jgi:hypothetical protein
MFPELVHLFGDDHSEEVNADAEATQLRTGDVVNVGRCWSKPDVSVKVIRVICR